MDRVPAELRLQIYEAHLSEARVFEPSFGSPYSQPFPKPSFHGRVPEEPLLETCHEARQVALKHGFFLFGDEGQPGVYFRKSDILFLNLESLISFGDIYHLLSTNSCDRKAFAALESLGRVENAAVEWASVVSSYGLRGICPRLGEWLPNVKKVFLAIPRVRYTTTASAAEPRFLKSHAAELRPIPDACILPKYTKQGEDDPTEGETWNTCGQTLSKKILDALHGRHKIDVQACFLHRAHIPQSPGSLKKDWLVYDDRALSPRQVTTATFNNTVAS